MLGLAATWLEWGTTAVGALGNIYWGYGPTLVGTLMGLPWAVVDGAIAGALIGLIYNYFQDKF